MIRTCILTAALTIIIHIMAPWPASAGDWWPAQLDDYLKGIESNVDVVDEATFREVHAGKKYELLVDLRKEAAFRKSSIDGAVNIPRGILEFEIWHRSGYPDLKVDAIRNKRIYLYCATGLRAILAAKALKDLNFKNVTAVKMDFESWEKPAPAVQEKSK